MSFFERYLSAWVAACIVAGLLIGQAFPGPVRAIGAMEVARVNIPVGFLIWVMIIPMLVRVDTNFSIADAMMAPPAAAARC